MPDFRPCARRPARATGLLALLSCLAASRGDAQHAPGRMTPATADSLATTRVVVRHDARPLEGVAVRGATDSARTATARTDATGTATLRLAPGPQVLVSTRVGFRPDTLRLTLRAGQDTALTVQLDAVGAELESVVVTATRSNRRVEDEPTRVEVVAPEEVAEKTAMQPASVSMLLNETSGIRVQQTSPGLGGASVRIQGLRGRYTQVLSDGLLLYGTTTEGLGLLQIPPLDLDHAEVIKGVASALYGGAALGGVVNLVSRRPTPATRELLVNQTSRGGTDAVLFAADSLSPRWGYTLLGGVHRQAERDVGGDGWADLAGYERAILRPRLVWTGVGGASLFATVGATLENRTGGTLAGHTVADGTPFALDLRTRRYDAGFVGRWPVAERLTAAVRASGTTQAQTHQFGPTRERDALGTGFAEAAVTATRGAHVLVGGLALQADRYRNRDVPGFDYAFTTPGLFVQDTYAPFEQLALTASGRVDRHNVYGTVLSPRVSVLARPGGAVTRWTTRLSAGAGFYAPTPFTEETAPIGLTPLARTSFAGGRALRAEPARSASADVGRTVTLGGVPVELNLTAYASVVDHPTALREVAGPVAGPVADPAAGSDGRLPLVTLAGPTRTRGGEAYARTRVGPVTVTGTYAVLRATEDDPDAAPGVTTRRAVPLDPRQSASLTAVYEQEASGTKLGLEAYYTGRQALVDDPYRTVSRPYVLAGLFAQRRVATPFGAATVFVNGENLGNVRQTRFDPLLRATPGAGGRWTTDAWAPLDGRVVNAGVRVGL